MHTVKSIYWMTLTWGEAVDEYRQWGNATSRFLIPMASPANISRAAPGWGAEQGKELQVVSSLHTSLAAGQVRDAQAEEETEIHVMHMWIMGLLVLPGIRQPSKGQVLQQHILKKQGHFRAMSNCSEDCKKNNLFKKKKKGKSKKTKI